MGRTPGKWIKNLLLGKKSAKKKSASKEDSALSELPKEFTVSSPVISAPLIAATVVSNNGVDSEIRAAAAAPEVPPSDDIVVSSGKEDGISTSEESRDVRKREEAATKAQSAYRGYVARRAYRTLKGIIRLQAVIRGHLVRRQAASTLLCVQGIVKLQALIRGQNVRHSEIGVDVQKRHQGDTCFNYFGVVASSQVKRVPKNVFAQKLLASLPIASPLRLQYVPEDPNSSGMWLDRWTISCSWELVLQPKKKPDQKSLGKNKNIQTLETEPAKPKRIVRRLSNENGPNRVTPDSEKSKRIIRKVSSHPENSVQDHQQNGVEKIKTNVRRVSDPKELSNSKKVSGPKKKVSDPKEEVSDTKGEVSISKKVSGPKKKVSDSKEDVSNPKEEVSGLKKKASDPKEEVSVPKKKVSYPKKEVSGQKKKNSDLKEEVDKEIPKHTAEVVIAPSLDYAEQCTSENSPKMQQVVVSNSKHSDPQLTPKNETMQKLDDGSFGDMENNGNNEGQPLNEIQTSADNFISNEDQKTSQRRASLSLNLDHRENVPTPIVPSYMAPTESARARLKGQESPRFTRDVVDKNLLTRRHSLSSSTNTNTSILSPRAQKLVQGLGVIKTDRSLSSSRDGFDKGIQPDWRR